MKEYKVGDLVSMTQSGLTYLGIIMEVGRNAYLIQFTDGDKSWFTSDWLEVIR